MQVVLAYGAESNRNLDIPGEVGPSSFRCTSSIMPPSPAPLLNASLCLGPPACSSLCCTAIVVNVNDAEVEVHHCTRAKAAMAPLTSSGANSATLRAFAQLWCAPAGIAKCTARARICVVVQRPPRLRGPAHRPVAYLQRRHLRPRQCGRRLRAHPAAAAGAAAAEHGHRGARAGGAAEQRGHAAASGGPARPGAGEGDSSVLSRACFWDLFCTGKVRDAAAPGGPARPGAGEEVSLVRFRGLFLGLVLHKEGARCAVWCADAATDRLQVPYESGLSQLHVGGRCNHVHGAFGRPPTVPSKC